MKYIKLHDDSRISMTKVIMDLSSYDPTNPIRESYKGKVNNFHFLINFNKSTKNNYNYHMVDS